MEEENADVDIETIDVLHVLSETDDDDEDHVQFHLPMNDTALYKDL